MKSEVGGRKSEVRFGFVIALFLLIMTACDNERELPDAADYNYDYFPLQVGKYWVYEVDSVLFVPDGNRTRRDSSKTWRKEEIISRFIDNARDTVYRVERFERRNPNNAWQIKQVFTMSRTATQAIQTEDNIRLLKLTFPLQQSVRWSSVVFINPETIFLVANQNIMLFKLWQNTAKVTNIGEPLKVNATLFPETATVSYIEETTVKVEYRIAKEVYARNVGLVQRDWHIMDTQCAVCCSADSTLCAKLPWEEKAERGFIIKQRLLEHN